MRPKGQQRWRRASAYGPTSAMPSRGKRRERSRNACGRGGLFGLIRRFDLDAQVPAVVAVVARMPLIEVSVRIRVREA